MTMFVVISCEGCPTKTIVANIARPDVSRIGVLCSWLDCRGGFESGQGECELPTRASATSR
jgi:hypothetical protein